MKDEFLQDLIFNKFDIDKNGTVDFREFMSGLSVMTRGTTEERLKGNSILYCVKLTWIAAFEMVDINGDGHIARDEFVKILVSLLKLKGGSVTLSNGKTVSNINEICDAFFGNIDRDLDGELSFEEFREGVANNPDILKGLNFL